MPTAVTVRTTQILAGAIRNTTHAGSLLLNPAFACAGGRWTICTHHDNATDGCVVLSVGIGNDWSYESLVLKRGCEVHAFDPTKSLYSKHNQTAARMRERFPKLHFHYVGLGSSLELNSAYNKHQSTGSDLSKVVHLDEMVATYVPNRRINVLKIDCEGCEYEAFDFVAMYSPRLLCNVSQVNIELHYSYKFHKLKHGSQLTSLLSHLWIDHGFRVFKASANTGWREEAKSVHPDLLRWGWPSYGCCHNVQLMRPNGRLDGEGTPACAPDDDMR